MTEADFRLSVLEPGDLVQAKGLSDALSWPYRLEDWAFALSQGEGLGFFDGERLIGTALRFNFGPNFATVGMIIVDSGYRGKRLGARLVDALLEGTGERSVILNATLDGLELYRRRGFKGFDVTCQHQGIAGAIPPSDPAFPVTPARDADWPAIIALDEAATGMDRSHLLKSLSGCARASILPGDGGSILGYAITREFGRGHVIGPVLAESREAAIALISKAMTGLEGKFVRLDTSPTTGLADWLEARGLIKVDSVEAMVRGSLPERTSPARIFALCSQSLG